MIVRRFILSEWPGFSMIQINKGQEQQTAYFQSAVKRGLDYADMFPPGILKFLTINVWQEAY